MSIFSVNDIEVTIGADGTPKRLAGDLMKIKKQKNTISDIFKLLQRESHFKLDNPKKELHLLKNEQDELGFQHLTFGRMYKGINIWGDELKFHINNKNELYLFDGDYQPSLPSNFSISPKLTNRQAEETALKTLSLDYAQKEETKLLLKIGKNKNMESQDAKGAKKALGLNIDYLRGAWGTFSTK